MKRFASLLLALAIILSLAVPAMAADITINGKETLSVDGRKFAAYKMFDATPFESYTEVTGAADNNAHYYKETSTGAYVLISEADTDITKYEKKAGSETELQAYAKGETKFTYTVVDAWKAFFTQQYPDIIANDPAYDAKIVAKMAEMTDDSDALIAFGEAAKTFAKTQVGEEGDKKDQVAATAEATGANGEVVFSSMDPGYYLILDTTSPVANENKVVSSVMLDTTDIEMTIKADGHTLKKTVEDKVKKITNGAIGDYKLFTITTEVPYTLGYTTYNFQMNDTMSVGLDFIQDDNTHPITVNIYNDDGTVAKNLTTTSKDNDAYYVLTARPHECDLRKTDINIDFKNMNKIQALQGKKIEVTYYGRINDDVTLTDTGVKNEVELIYSNDPTDETVNGKIPRVYTDILFTTLKLKKTDNEGKVLTGAEFKLEGTSLNQVRIKEDVFTEDTTGTYWKLKNGGYTEINPANLSDDYQKLYDSTTTKYKLESGVKLAEGTDERKNITATVDEKGELTFHGLAAGTYTITETKAPAGYNLLKGSITVTVAMAGNSAAQPNWTYTWNVTETADDELVSEGEGTNSNAIVVVNNPGLELPETGGMGTTLFYVVGAGLMLAAIVLLVAKKRAAN